MISAIDVMRGALAVAGSNFNLVNMNGIVRPTRLPAITARIIVRATTRMISGALKLAIRETPRAIVIPSRNETMNSLPTSLKPILQIHVPNTPGNVSSE